MRITTTLLALAGAVSAHYTFPALIYGGTTTTDWQYPRHPLQRQRHTVAAGQPLGFTVNPDIYHPGPLMAYMAKVPSGSTAGTWAGDGTVWFKIYQDEPAVSSSALIWPSNGDTTVTFTIPAATPSGDYLFRVEHIGLHVAETEGGAQFYLSCGQITVMGGGSGTPGPLVAFPGAYSPTDPGILIDIYYPIPTNYTPPGPAVWSG